MEENISQDTQPYDHLSSATPVANSVMIVPRTVDDELPNVSLNENGDYLSNHLSHIRLLHRTANTDPNLNHHNRTIGGNNRVSTDVNQYQHRQVLQYFTDTSNERLKLLKSKSISTSSPSNSTIETTYDPNSDMTFLYDLVTPPSTINRRSVQSQSNTNITNLFDDGWNG
jgi:hypothetical protein